jgi:hypothetical protein
MMTPMTARQIFDREFLELRAKVLELAASLDRLDRAEGDTADDPRRRKLDEALRLLLAPAEDRAERVQMIFSREYEPDWLARFQLARRSSEAATRVTG